MKISGTQADEQASSLGRIEGAPRRAHEQEVEDRRGLGAVPAREVEAEEEVMALSREDLGSRIARAREAKGLSQSDLARTVELNQSAVSRIESGERGVVSPESARAGCSTAPTA